MNCDEYCSNHGCNNGPGCPAGGACHHMPGCKDTNCPGHPGTSPKPQQRNSSMSIKLIWQSPKIFWHAGLYLKINNKRYRILKVGKR